LTAWSTDGVPREEIAAIWDGLNLLLEYRNFIHVGKAVRNENAYWQNILNREPELISAVDRCLEYLSDCCNGL